MTIFEHIHKEFDKDKKKLAVALFVLFFIFAIAITGVSSFFNYEIIKNSGVVKTNVDESFFNYLLISFVVFSIPLAVILSYFPYIYTKRLIKSKEQYLEIIDKNVLMSISDVHGNIIEVSSALLELSGYTRAELIGNNHNIFRHPDTPKETFENMWNTILDGKTWVGNLKDLKKDGSVFWVEVKITPMFDENHNIKSFTALREDITYRKLVEELSITDELTTLYNKRHFNSIFPNELKRADRANFPIIFAIIDVDNFKLFNDTYGHQEGDKTLQKIGVVLHKNMKRATDYAFRIGGEEFALVFTEDDPKKAFQFLNKLRKEVIALNIPHKHNSIDCVTITVGYKYLKPKESLTEDEIYKLADEALYNGKNSGKNRVERSNEPV